nr:hypothetical protein [Saprospiraceae bacterium]
MITKKILHWKLNRNVNNREKYRGINPVKNLIVVFSISKDSPLDPILQYAKKLENNQKSVELLGYFPGKRKEFQKKFADLPFQSFTRSDLNFFLSPKKPELKAILNREADLLINLDLMRLEVIHLLVSSSRAHFKVGMDLKRQAVYDLMIETGDQCTLQNTIDHTKEVMNSVFSNDLQLS